MTLRLTREADLATEWALSHEQFRLLRRRHQWAHVKFSRNDIRYTDDQIEQIVRDMTTRAATKPNAKTGQTSRSMKAAS